MVTLYEWQWNQGPDWVEDDVSVHARAMPSFTHADVVANRLVAGSELRQSPASDQTVFAWGMGGGIQATSFIALASDDPGGDDTTIDFSTYQAYIDIPLQAAAGKQLVLDTLNFDWTRGGGATPRGFGLRSSHDNYASWIGSPVTNIPTQRAMTSYSIDLSGIPAANSIRLRLFVWTPFQNSDIESYGDSDGPGWVITGDVTSAGSFNSNIKIAGQEVKRVFAGLKEITRVYIGNTLVFQPSSMDDTFPGTTLDPKWTVRDIPGLGTVAVNDGLTLACPASAEGLYNPYGQVPLDRGLIIHQSHDNSNFEVRSNWTVLGPGTTSHGFVFANDDWTSWMRIDMIRFSNRYRWGIIDGSAGQGLWYEEPTLADVSAPLLLRVGKQGDDWYGQWSVDDGATWDPGFTGITRALDVRNIGLMLGAGSSTAPTVEVDRFEFEKLKLARLVVGPWQGVSDPAPGQYKTQGFRIACNPDSATEVGAVRAFWQTWDGYSFVIRNEEGTTLGTLTPSDYTMQENGYTYPGPAFNDSGHPAFAGTISTSATSGVTTLTIDVIP